MTDPIWRVQTGRGPLIATAIHDGHDVRDDVAGYLALSDSERFGEEDPFTGQWTAIAPVRVIGTRSRFEADLNRPRDKAVYRRPEDAWGLTVWKGDPPPGMFEESLAEYDLFYDSMRTLLEEMSREYGRFVVFDLHSYNHRRQGPDGPPADISDNPQVNVGTGTMNRDRWGPVADAFIDTLHGVEFPGGRLDVRENVKFRGGRWPQWIHENFADSGVAIAIEFKKFFMDEWTGIPNRSYIEDIKRALQATTSAVLNALKSV
ncbi:MAG: N-formylglutamate amidohydrolase [Planctomycetes bacterium]|nr:N-formylglutamate amidohydrolase [Planctomycetota bacterium]